MTNALPTAALFADEVETMADAIALGRELGVTFAGDVVPTPFAAAGAREAPDVVAIAALRPPTWSDLLGVRPEPAPLPALMHVIGPPAREVALAPELGIAVFPSIASLVSGIVLLRHFGAERPAFNLRALAAVDRARVGLESETGDRLVRLDGGYLGTADGGTTIRFGRPEELAAAVHALRRVRRRARPSLPRVEDADAATAREVLMGPARALSDPASKSALEPYDLPLPVEELCTTASRALVESARIGYPVRLTLATPDLRTSDHPDLVIEGVNGSARVRDAFRELVALAESRRAGARVLGVTVSASTTVRCSLALRIERVTPRLLVGRLAFADAYARATGAAVQFVLPATPDDLAQAFARLEGASLLGSPGAERKNVDAGLTDVVFRIAAFMSDFAEEVQSVELLPLAVLVTGDFEIREARVVVTDAFERDLR